MELLSHVCTLSDPLRVSPILAMYKNGSTPEWSTPPSYGRVYSRETVKGVHRRGSLPIPETRLHRAGADNTPAKKGSL